MIQVVKKHVGLGDTVEFLLEKTGIKYAVEQAVKLAGAEDCGCTKRKEWLNEKVNYGRKE